MKPGAVPVAVLVAAACRAEVPVEEMSVLDTTQAEARSVEELPPQPEIPVARRGHLSATSAGNFRLNGQWRAEADVCESRAVLELFGGVRGMRTLLVIHFNTERGWDGRYSFTLPDSTALPEPPVARLAVQVFQDAEAMGFQAIEGEVDLTTTDGSVSGSFEAILRESQSHLLVWYVGSFDRIHAIPADRAHCDQLVGEETLDSAVIDTAEVTDTLD